MCRHMHVVIVGTVLPAVLAVYMVMPSVAQASTGSASSGRTGQAATTTAGKNIGKASQVTSTVTGSLHSKLSDDWWVMFPPVAGGTVHLRVKNTLKTNSGGCDLATVQLWDTNGRTDTAIVTTNVSPNTASNLNVSEPGSDRYFAELSTGGCTPPNGSPVTYSIDVVSGGGGTDPNPTSGSAEPSTTMAGAGPPLQGHTSYTGSIVTNTQSWYLLDKKADSNSATIRVENTTTLTAAIQAGTCDASFPVVFTDSHGNPITTVVLKDNSAATFTTPIPPGQTSGDFYLDFNNDGDTYPGCTAPITYRIEPEPASEWDSCSAENSDQEPSSYETADSVLQVSSDRKYTVYASTSQKADATEAQGTLQIEAPMLDAGWNFLGCRSNDLELRQKWQQLHQCWLDSTGR